MDEFPVFLPFIDWDGNGRVDPDDVALSLAILESADEADDE